MPDLDSTQSKTVDIIKRQKIIYTCNGANPLSFFLKRINRITAETMKPRYIPPVLPHNGKRMSPIIKVLEGVWLQTEKPILSAKENRKTIFFA